MKYIQIGILVLLSTIVMYSVISWSIGLSLQVNQQGQVLNQVVNIIQKAQQAQPVK